jgi:hypothetical protein
MTTTGKNRIMIYGPKTDGAYVVEFRTAEGEALAISIPTTETAVIRHFQERICRNPRGRDGGVRQELAGVVSARRFLRREDFCTKSRLTLPIVLQRSPERVEVR